MNDLSFSLVVTSQQLPNGPGSYRVKASSLIHQPFRHLCAFCSAHITEATRGGRVSVREIVRGPLQEGCIALWHNCAPQV